MAYSRHSISLLLSLTKTDYSTPTDQQSPVAPPPLVPPGSLIDAQWSGIAGGVGANVSLTPPDNALAVSDNGAVVSLENAAILWSDAKNLYSVQESLSYFFSIASGVDISKTYTSIFDPRVTYDQAHKQFIVVTDATGVDPTTGAKTSGALVAISASPDPTGKWYFQAVDTNTSAGGQSLWGDYPMVAVDNANIYISLNDFKAINAQETDKTLAASLVILSNVFGPVGLASGGQSSVSTQTWDFAMYGLASLQPVTNTTGGVFLLSSSNYNQLSYSYWNSAGVAQNTTIPLGSIEVAGNYIIPQSGSTLNINSGDGRIQSLALKGDELFAVFDIIATSDALPSVHWVDLNVQDPTKPSVIDQGDVTLPSGAATFNPSVAFDVAGDVVINFTAASGNVPLTDYYTIRPAGALGPNSFNAPTAFQMASIAYTNNQTSGSVRWGDYSSAVADPSNAHAFWISNESVLNASTWGTITAHLVVAPTTMSTPIIGTQSEQSQKLLV